MIRFDQVTKRYPGGIDAIRHLSFHVERGEMVFLAGHSGAGKSTLLKLIAGIERATSGNVTVNGQNLSKIRASQLPYVRQHIGIVFQDHKVLYDRSVFDNVMLPLEIIGFDRREAARRAHAALEKVGLASKEKALPIRLSGGEQQRLCIARAVVHRPAILLADEPSANLDRAYALDIMELFKSFHQVGVTVVISAHDESLMADYASRILRLSNGQFAA
ncbi:cell division ATP-binding protein FtsE [Laribacter hongkongensis]|jgi:cell division transport system ATP-binding protein|uniref:Cell division ATP-binding protein FtsE n=2 Tax=Laribacter hongkongensis TaxID=168471 RepID=C1DAP7_LARHH|nr:cell division ATP-binding protein FtsE [Laribacter hongkongensis]ACO73228.1 FtsE [Laribacter hongkongensis HLHK9]ASJ23064.1 cell division ATP-binding protein FtsE [Laribacter hongkongensis]MBE5527616.1 cell division ATP-binding protein FtsE [Laribacter hongkongensis]MCG8993749.1 cell division ATP-binding protein FtsE [Laribacter hongkongensis]MCG8996597.1 cell division ATP-binding protein FtsE [Laribacter hongkongensis]